MRPSWNMAHHLQMQQQLQSQQQVATYTILQLDKATQTDGDYTGNAGDSNILLNVTDTTAMMGGPGDFKIGKVMRERLQSSVSARTTMTTATATTSTATGGGGGDDEHSVSSQTLSPLHGKCCPACICVKWSGMN